MSAGGVTARAARVALSMAMLVLAEASCVPPADRCGDEPGCAKDYEFAIDPDCVPESGLELALIEGWTPGQPVSVGELPEVHRGAQGGMHMLVGIRIINPDPAHASYQVGFVAESDCISPASLQRRDAGAWWCEAGSHEVVLNASLVDEPGGSLQAAGIPLMIDRDLGELGGRVTVTARDTCDRHGSYATERRRWPLRLEERNAR